MERQTRPKERQKRPKERQKKPMDGVRTLPKGVRSLFLEKNNEQQHHQDHSLTHTHRSDRKRGDSPSLVSVADLLAHIHAHIHVHAHTYTSTHIHTHTHTYIHSYIHKHTDTHRQTDRHTHTHTQERQEAGGSAHLVSTAGAERTTNIAVLLAAALYAARAARHRGLCWLENKFYSEVEGCGGHRVYSISRVVLAREHLHYNYNLNAT